MLFKCAIKTKKYSLLLIILSFILLLQYPAYSAGEIQQSVVKWLTEKGINQYIIPALISMLPISELRGGIPVGLFVFKLNPIYVFIICIISNMIPVVPLLFFLNGIMRVLSRKTGFSRIIQRLETRARRNEKLIERYKEFGLLLFVAIPLPVTGAWTGSLLSTFFNLNIYKSMLFIGFGVITAGFLVMGISLLGKSFLIGAIALIVVLIALYFLIGAIKHKKLKQPGENR